MSEEHRTLSDEEIVTTPGETRFRQQEDSDLGDDTDTTDADTDDTDSDADDTDAS
jgi:hypothetical protein